MLLAAGLLALLPGPASAVLQLQMKAEEIILTMPDGTAVPSWGFGLNGLLDVASVPGPPIVVPVGETTLEITLTNNLPVPVSIVIPGQKLPVGPSGKVEPVWTAGLTGTVVSPASPGFRNAGDVTARMRSMVHETAPGAASTYIFTDLKPGTYLYESGTNQQVQVPMGLYGAMIQNAGVNEAYAGIAYSQQALLIFSALDPAFNTAVSNGMYGPHADPVPAGWYTNTKEYDAKYYLVNGQPFPAWGPDGVLDATLGGNTLLRFVNAGVETFIPILQGMYMNLVAQDGRPFTYIEGGAPVGYSKQQYSIELGAGQTVDALIQLTTPGQRAIYDGRLNLTNAGNKAMGGLFTFLSVGAPAAGDGVGPTTSGALVAPNPTAGAQQVVLTATADDSATGGSTIVRAEWFDGADPGVGLGKPMLAADGSFDGVTEGLTATIDVAGWAAGLHNLNVRSRDAAGNWGAPTPAALTVSSVTDTVTILKTRYASSVKKVKIWATTTAAPGTVTLTAQGLGALNYRARYSDYYGAFKSKKKPGNVTVNSTGGGTDTKAVPYN
jgi:FtsP/CotA-like multicopper oxidase with cupredoxin domain